MNIVGILRTIRKFMLMLLHPYQYAKEDNISYINKLIDRQRLILEYEYGLILRKKYTCVVDGNRYYSSYDDGWKNDFLDKDEKPFTMYFVHNQKAMQDSFNSRSPMLAAINMALISDEWEYGSEPEEKYGD